MIDERQRRAWLISLGLHAWLLTIGGTLALAHLLRPSVPSESPADRVCRSPIPLTLGESPAPTPTPALAESPTPAELPIPLAGDLLPTGPLTTEPAAPVPPDHTPTRLVQAAGLVQAAARSPTDNAGTTTSTSLAQASYIDRSSNGAGDETGASGGLFAGKRRPTAGRIVYLLDRSASMGLERRLARAIAALTAHAAELPPACAVGVVAYNRQAVVVEVPAGQERLAALGRGLAFLVAEGGSDHVLGLRRALTLAPDGIYWLTDIPEPERHAALRQAGVGRQCWVEPIDLTGR
jgi:hypothetical protein